MTLDGAADDDVDLAPDRRAYIAETYERLGVLKHHELLGVPRDADKKTVKQAYFRLAGLVHPDRYFGKRLGKYKPMMEAIFVRLTESLEVLSRSAPARAKVAPELEPAPPPPPVATAVPPKAAPSPEKIEQAQAKGRALAEKAERAAAAGDLETAVASYRMALALLPNDRELRARYEAVATAARQRSVENLVRQATMEERYGHFAEAAATWGRVLQANPNHPEAERRKSEAEQRTRTGG